MYTLLLLTCMTFVSADISASSTSSVASVSEPPSATSTLIPLDYAPDFSNDPYPPYPDVYQADGSNFTAENWRGTRLFGWKGCGKQERSIIVETWNDFHTLSGQDALKNIDWDSQAAQEIWGHDTRPRYMIPAERKAQIKQIYKAAAQMYSSSWVPPYYTPPWWGWENLWIRVQCSPDGDDENRCHDNQPNPGCPPGQPPPPPGNRQPVESYPTLDEKYSKVTFCNYFFNGAQGWPAMKSLSEAMRDVKSGAEPRNDLWSYQNRARIMFHEMTHLSYFMNAPKKSPEVEDVIIDARSGRNQRCYGPENVKQLANYQGRVDKGGFFTQRNADSYAWFVMAKYAESQIGQYPVNPVENYIPPRSPRNSNNQLYALTANEVQYNNATNATESSDADLQDSEHYIPGCGDLQLPKTAVVPVNTGQSLCDDKDSLSAVPYNVFSGQDTGVYAQFCFEFHTWEQNGRTVDSRGNPISVAGQKMKRTPPPNPSTYDSYKFHLEWTPDTTASTCTQTVDDCLQAFHLLSESPCGHQGGEQNVMSSAGNFTIPGCGAYSYNITGPSSNSSSPTSSSTSTSLPSPTLGSQWCYPARDNHKDVHDDDQERGVTSTCWDTKGKIVIDGDPSTNLHKTTYALNGPLPYKYNVFWKPGCKSSVTKVDIGDPLGDGKHTCYKLLRDDFKHCYNGGLGGNITVGCLTYSFIGGNM